MSLFKKKIKFGDLIADMMEIQLGMVENNFNKFIDLDDKNKVMTVSDKEELHNMIDFLVLSYMSCGCINHLSNKIPEYDISFAISFIYVKYLKQYRKMETDAIMEKSEKFLEFMEYWLNYQGENSKNKELTDIDELGFNLSKAFTEYYAEKVSSNQQKETEPDRKNAVLAYAMATIKGDLRDLVGLMLKEYKIIDQSWIYNNPVAK